MGLQAFDSSGLQSFIASGLQARGPDGGAGAEILYALCDRVQSSGARRVWLWDGVGWSQAAGLSATRVIGFQGSVYGTSDRLFRWTGLTWVEVSTPEMGAPGVMRAFGGLLYVAFNINPGLQIRTWNGTTWTDLPPFPSTAFRLDAIEVHLGAVIAAGQILGQQTLHWYYRLVSGAWVNMSVPPFNTGRTIALLDGGLGTLYAGGNGQIDRRMVARLDDQSGAWTLMNPMADVDAVWDLQHFGGVCAGASHRLSGPLRVFRLSGVAWDLLPGEFRTIFGDNSPTIFRLDADNDRLYAAGYWRTLDGQSVSQVCRFDPASSSWMDLVWPGGALNSVFITDASMVLP